MYVIRAANAGGAATSGTITVTENAPAGLSIAAMSGTGWSCQENACTRSDTFTAGRMLPAIRVVVSVDPNAAAMVSNSVTVSGGGDTDPTNNTATDLTPVSLGGYPVSWGDSLAIGSHVPYVVSDAVAAATGDQHALLLKKDGTVLEWSSWGASKSITGWGLNRVVAVAAGRDATYALSSDGTVAAWGRLSPSPVVPADLADVVAIAAAGDYCLAVKGDGTVTGFGSAGAGELNIPANLTGVVGLSTTVGQVIALKWDGTVAVWGNTAPAVPGNLPKLVKAASVGAGTLAGIKTDGTVVAWNTQGGGLTALPGGLSHVVDLTGDGYVLAIKDDGTVTAWGDNTYGQTAKAPQLASVVSAAGATTHAVAIVFTAMVNVTVETRILGKNGPITNSYQKPTVLFDGVAYSSPYTVSVIPGTRHEITTTATQTFAANVRYHFAGWSNGGPATQVVYPETDTAYTANFQTQYQLTTAAGTGGTISPASEFLDAGAEVQVRATPQAPYQFSDFTVLQASQGNNPLRLIMDSAVDVTANFVQPSGTLPRVTLQSAGPLVQGQANAEYVARIANIGTAPLTGVTVQTDGSGLTVTRAWGTGWTCTGGNCSRSDTLQPGQSYPALAVIATVDAAAVSATLNVSVAPVGSSQAKGASVVTPVAGAANGLIAWGDNTYNQRNAPSGLANLVAVSAGARHSLALKGDGTMAAWGDNTKQQTTLPGNAGVVVAVASGAYHNLALNRSGGVTAWGENFNGQTTVPAAATEVVAVAAGANHSLALTSSGTAVAWGANNSGQRTVPASVVNAVAIAAGGDHSLAVLADGTVVAWGSNTAGESTVPANLTRVVGVAAGAQFSLAAQDDGAVVAWGNVPASVLSAMPAGLASIRIVAAGSGHALAVGWDGSVQAWGDNASGQSTVPANLLQVTGAAGGAAHSLAITGVPAPITVSFSTKVPGLTYLVDGLAYTAPQAFVWTSGSTHTVAMPPVQQDAQPGIRHLFAGWSDGGTQASRTIQYGASVQLVGDTYPCYLVMTGATTGGAIVPNTGYIEKDKVVTFQASPSLGYAFTGFSGDMQGQSYPRDIKVVAPLSVTANFAPIGAQPSLGVDLRRTSNFLRGQANAAYLLRVTNGVQGATTSGSIQVSLNVPSGLQVQSMRGPGWTCATTSCSRSDALDGGSFYPAILVLASVGANAPASVTLQATVSGGGDPSSHTGSVTAPVNATAIPVARTMASLVPTTPFPENLTDVVSVSVGSYHFVALRKDGTVVAWGNNDQHQCDVPQGLTNVIAVAAGGLYSVALKADGSVVAWGSGAAVSLAPAGITDLVDVQGGYTFVVGLRADGTLQYWGDSLGIHTVFAARARNIVAIAAGNTSIALDADGSVLALDADIRTFPPPGTPKAASIAVGGSMSAMVSTDGTAYNWFDSGLDTWPGWTNLSRIAIAGECSVAQRTDGSILTDGCEDATASFRPQDIARVSAIFGGAAGAVLLTDAPPTVSYQLKSASGTVKADGVSYPSGQTFQWTYGSSHTISVASPTSEQNGERSVFDMWTDGGAVSHTVTANATRPVVIEAYFKNQYYVTTSASTGGTIIPPTGWYNYGSLQVTATPDPGYVFKDFTGISSGGYATTTFTLNQPMAITALFEPNGKAPVLSITSTHIGNFTQGEQSVNYTLVVRNASGAGPTSGQVTLTNTLPAGLTAVSMSGTGWTCPSASTCTRSDALAAASSYPPIVVKANVALNAASPVTNQASVSGGGSATASASDSTVILTQVNLATVPAGLNVIVDGVTYATPKTLGWASGSSHTLAVLSPQGSATVRNVFIGWSDNGAQSHSVTAGSTPVAYTASFGTQYPLTTAVTPSGAGSLAASPVSADGWYDAGQVVQITATPAYAWTFASFSGALTGAANPQSVAMTAAKNISAMFTAIDPHPVAVGVTPSSGSGSTTTLSATYAAGLGYQDLAWVQLLVAAATDGGGQPFCFLHYDVQGDSFWVYGEEGFFLGPVKRGQASAHLQNSFCAFNPKTSTIAGNGTNLLWKADVTFKGAGARQVYLRANTNGNLDTGWVQKGTWTAAAAPLSTMTTTPGSGSGAAQTFIAQYTDPASFEGEPVGWAQFLIAAATDGGGQPFCFLHYDRGGNGLWMYSSDVGFFLGPVAPGTASNALDSSACSINTATASIQSQAGTLSIQVPVTLKPPMSGTKNLYQRILDPILRDSGWIQAGTWNVP